MKPTKTTGHAADTAGAARCIDAYRYRILGYVPKRLNEFVAEILSDEGQSDHAAEVLGCLLESREDAAVFLKPADESLNDVATTVRLAVEVDQPRVTILVLFGGNHRCDAQIQQVLVDPIGPISLIAAQSEGPRDALAVVIEQLLVGRYQEFVQDLRFVGLASSEPKGQWQAVAVAEDVDLRRKSPARAA